MFELLLLSVFFVIKRLFLIELYVGFLDEEKVGFLYVKLVFLFGWNLKVLGVIFILIFIME